jgi:hypothetical protein
VQLVERLETPVPTNHPQATDGPELLWTGTDLPISGAITAALDKAGIPYHTQTRDVGLLPGLSQPVYAIFIPTRHHDAAQPALEDARHQFEDTQQPLDVANGDSAPSNEPPTERSESDVVNSTPDFVPESYDPDEATEEVWSGNDADMKDMLIASLRENGIGCELDNENNPRIRVMPAASPRAREIVREVTEASPPE